MSGNYFLSNYYLKYKQLRSLKNNTLLFPIHKNTHPKYKLTDILFNIQNHMLTRTKHNPVQSDHNIAKSMLNWNHKRLSISNYKCYKQRPLTVAVTPSRLHNQTFTDLSCTSIKLGATKMKTHFRNRSIEFARDPPKAQREQKKITIFLNPLSSLSKSNIKVML